MHIGNLSGRLTLFTDRGDPQSVYDCWHEFAKWAARAQGAADAVCFGWCCPLLVEELSRHVILEPGDVIFTGTPAG